MENGFHYTQNRELSWLQFNARVLDEATDESVPLLERLKFLQIFTSNLDEFFMVRVGRLLDCALIDSDRIDPKSGMTPNKQLDTIYRVVRPLYTKRDRYFAEIINQMHGNGIHFLSYKHLSKKEIKFVSQYFKQSISPVLSPQIVDSHHPFPNLQNKVLYIAARLKYKGKETYGFVPISAVLPEVLYLPGHSIRLLPMAEVIQENINQLFPGYSCTECVQLCLTRNADVSPEDDVSVFCDDFRKQMQIVIDRRKHQLPVRLELSSTVSQELEQYLRRKTSLSIHQIFVSEAPLKLNFVFELNNKLSEAKRSILSYPPYIPQYPAFISARMKMMRQVQRNDILLSYPYESMVPFLCLIREAAYDPTTISIKITIYRLAKNSKLVDYLCAAAENGKDVTVLIELRARFDEQNNIDWSEKLKEAGCTIIYGFQEYKVHSKICLITRKEHGIIRYITQIGTGNYNEKTASMYTDLSLITANQNIGRDAGEFFKNMMIGNLNVNCEHLLVAPFSLKSSILKLFDREIKKGEQGRIILKLNSVSDLELIKKLREASRAGVSITMIVRGICCILPGIPGETDHVEIRSIVGRFLEHSRIYSFGIGSEEKLFISSADFMTRNTQQRVEIACPIYDRAVKEKIHHILDLCMQDNAKSRQMCSDGTYSKIRQNDMPIDCQKQLMEETISKNATVQESSHLLKKLRSIFNK